MDNKFFNKKYDAIFIGCSLANMSCALKLSQAGMKNILILEQHNLPGGVATSFVRSGVEFEATLHQMMSIGNQSQLAIGKFFKEFGIDIDWITIPEAYRFVTPEYDVLIHAGTDGNLERTAKDIASVCDDKDGKKEKRILAFLKFCMKIHDSVDQMSKKDYSRLQLLFKFPELALTAGYSSKIVMDAFLLPKRAQEILSAYWIYLGNSPKELSITVYGYLLADYLGYGPSIPRYFSHDFSLKMQEKCEEMGVQVEMGQQVDKILVSEGKVKGVTLKSGLFLESPIVISGAYPNTVYSKMIEPQTEIPKKALKLTNFRKLSLSCFSIILLLEGTPEELNIKTYSTFYAPKGMDFNAIWDDAKNRFIADYSASVCHTLVNPDASEKGKTVYSITVMPRTEAWQDITEDEYDKEKHRIAEKYIEIESKRLGVDLRSRIIDITIETPVTISHYTGAYLGAVYGYLHTMNDTVVARTDMHMSENYISGLFFSGAHQVSGDGMSPAITNGMTAAKEVLAFTANKKKGN